jgi:HPt (histidine-containing phosphotransfer) domain-containing protein
MDRTSIDVDILRALRELGAATGANLLADLVAAFNEDAEARLTALRRAVVVSDESAIRAQAHSLKGMCGAIGAVHMAALSEALERAIHEDASAGHAGIVDILEAEFVRVKAALQMAALPEGAS